MWQLLVYLQLGKSCYLMPTYSKTWHQAFEVCRDVYRSHLVRFETLSELHAVTHFKENLWVGARRLYNGRFYWEDCKGKGSFFSCKYTEVNRAMWATGGPNNDGGKENYVNKNQFSGKLNDWYNHARRFVCEYEL